MAKSRIKYSAKNASSGVLYNITRLLSGFVSRMIFIYFLGEGCLGLNGLFTSILSLFSLADLGIGQAITFYMYKPIAEQNHARLSQLVKFYKFCYRIIGIVIAVIGVALIPFLPKLVNFEEAIGYNVTLLYLLYLADTVVGYLFFSYPQTVLSANQEEYLLLNTSTVFAVVTLISDTITLLLTRNYIVYLCAKILLVVVKNIYIAVLTFKKYPYVKTREAKNISLSEIKEMFKDVYSIFIVKMAAQLFNSTDNLFISVMFGTVLVGYNSNYVLLISTISGLAGTCIYACTGSVGDLVASSTKDVIYSRFKLIDYLNFCLSGFCGVCLYALLNPFITLVWGSHFTFSPAVVAVMCLNFYLTSAMATVYMFRQGMGLFRQYAYSQLFAAILNVVLNLILGKTIGIAGIFLATLIANCALAYIPIIKSLFQYGFEMSYKQQVKTMLLRLPILFVIAAALQFLCRDIPNTVGWFALRTVIVVVVCGVCILLTSLKDKRYQSVLSYAKVFLKRKMS